MAELNEQIVAVGYLANPEPVGTYYVITEDNNLTAQRKEDAK